MKITLLLGLLSFWSSLFGYDVKIRVVDDQGAPVPAMLSHFKSLNINWSDGVDSGRFVFKSVNSLATGVFEIA